MIIRIQSSLFLLARGDFFLREQMSEEVCYQRSPNSPMQARRNWHLLLLCHIVYSLPCFPIPDSNRLTKYPSPRTPPLSNRPPESLHFGPQRSRNRRRRCLVSRNRGYRTRLYNDLSPDSVFSPRFSARKWVGSLFRTKYRSASLERISDVWPEIRSERVAGMGGFE